MRLQLAMLIALLFGTVVCGQVVVDHQPYPLGGSTSDSEHLFNGQPFWGLSADDFTVNSHRTVTSVVWWGYFRSPAPTDETMRIRLYDARPSDGLPGAVLFEEPIFEPSRTLTGRFIADQGQPPEYRFQTTLSTPMLLNAATPYWLEISQVGDLSSWFLHELSIAERSPHAFINPATVDWRRTIDQVDLAFQLITPEPATAALLAIGAVALRTARRRRSSVSIKP